MKKIFVAIIVLFACTISVTVKAQQLPSAKGKILKLPYVQMALNAKLIGTAINDTNWFMGVTLY